MLDRNFRVLIWSAELPHLRFANARPSGPESYLELRPRWLTLLLPSASVVVCHGLVASDKSMHTQTYCRPWCKSSTGVTKCFFTTGVAVPRSRDGSICDG